MTAPRALEADCQRTIIAAASLHGWRVHATRPARMGSGRWATPIQGHAGFPDLLLARRDVVRVVELKRKPNKIEPEQHAWINALRAAGITTEICWCPEGMDDFIRTLA